MLFRKDWINMNEGKKLIVYFKGSIDANKKVLKR